MTEARIFNLLFHGGNIALPYLLKITEDGINGIYLVNNNQDIIYNDRTYKASTFSYTPPSNDGSGGSLEITSIDNNLVQFIDAATFNAKLEVVGLIVENGDVQPIKTYKHFYGDVTINDVGTITWNLGRDSRLDMVFTPYMYDTDTNRGNA